ncbi:hypothetical protein HON01_08845, partial [Candidatus Woesearchaeota archaeon]|nr:hypothetical protein [Candidatus Woesearchaeota archaeon]
TEPELTEDEKKLEMDEGKKDEDVYDKEGLEQLREDDEIETWEEGFAEGANEDGQLGKCANCGQPLMGTEDVIETKINDEIKRFCSRFCVDEYKEKNGIEEETA